jgi:hypothetical protein
MSVVEFRVKLIRNNRSTITLDLVSNSVMLSYLLSNAADNVSANEIIITGKL